ncbi:MAG: radical SAM protein [Gammaproteobacteria bacterium]|nr:radical SAM protein [Gammaproteobacteria bacterium]
MSRPTFKPHRKLYAKTPAVIQIETTIKCNATCWFCPQNNALRQPNYMEESIWKKIIDESRGLGVTYRPFLLNEPFADKRMVDIVRYIKQDPTAKVEFNTNGSMLTHKVTDKLLEIGVDTMRFSIDGFYKTTFDESRGINYDRVYDHVGYFLAQAKQASKPVQTEVRMIRLPGTDQEQVEFKAYWEKHAPDQVVFTDLYRYPWEGQTYAVNKPCLKVQDEMFFYVDGTATLCCWDSKGRQIVGDIKTESLLDIWGGQKLASCRALLDAGKRDQLELCMRCDAYENVDFSEWEGFVADEQKTSKFPPIPVNVISV